MGKKILVVDDEANVIIMLKTMLETNNYSVVSATDGTKGLKKAIEEKPDLILLDILMPNKDGLATLKELRIKESTKQIPVIMLTAKGESGYLMKAREVGVEDYIIKPYDVQELLELIKRHIR